MVGLHHDHDGRRCCIEPLPDLLLPRMRGERIQEDRLALRLDNERRHLGLPVEAVAPGWMWLAPEPQTGRHVAHLDHAASVTVTNLPATLAPVA
jgi:hypothetical protein